MNNQCALCHQNFVSLQDCGLCKECFLNPDTCQRECYSSEDFARKLGKNNMYQLTEDEEKNVPPISDERWKQIIVSIYGNN